MAYNVRDAIMQALITCGVHGILNTNMVAGVIVMIIGIKLLYLLQQLRQLLQQQEERLQLVKITIQIIHLR